MCCNSFTVSVARSKLHFLFIYIHARGLEGYTLESLLHCLFTQNKFIVQSQVHERKPISFGDDCNMEVRKEVGSALFDCIPAFSQAHKGLLSSY